MPWQAIMSVKDEYIPWMVLNHILRDRTIVGKRLIDRFSTPERIFQSPEDELFRVEGVTADIVRGIKSPTYPSRDMMDEIEKITDRGIRLIHLGHPDYPEMLRNIDDPPLYFFMKGHIAPEDSKAIAIVGTRRPTIYGKRVAEWLASELSLAGFTIVSGLARGIDSIAHRASLQVGGRTIAVLGCGIDVVYPRENSRLLSEIVEKGYVISEFPLGTGPEKKNFPKRNRLISGLSLGTVVVEAAEKSGSLITARFALEQGREVFAVPGNINSEMSKGTNNLIREGAKLVAKTEDILEEFERLLTHEIKRDIKNNSTDLPVLSDDERDIFEILTLQPKHIEQIVTESGLSPQLVMSSLFSLEMKGLIEKLAGGCYVRGRLR